MSAAEKYVRRRWVPTCSRPRYAALDWTASARTSCGIPASLAIASGPDAKVVQLMLGHKAATMTLDGHLFPDELDELADRLDDAVCAPGVNREPTDEAEEDDW